MATVLKATPILKGKESKRFNSILSANENNKISKAKKDKMFALVNKVLAKNA
ncbi:hypothetical protein FQZ97_1170860 [compost metagenome]